MTKNEKFTRAYVKYMIKTPVLFYLFLLLGVGLFLTLGLLISVDSADGYVSLLYAIFIRAGRGI